MKKQKIISERVIWAQFILRKDRSGDVEKSLRGALKEAHEGFSMLQDDLRRFRRKPNADKMAWLEFLDSNNGFYETWRKTFIAPLYEKIGISQAGYHSLKTNQNILNQRLVFIEFGEHCIRDITLYLHDRLWADDQFLNADTDSERGRCVGFHLKRAFSRAKIFAALEGAGLLEDGKNRNMIDSLPGYLSTFRNISRIHGYEGLVRKNLLTPKEMAKEIRKERLAQGLSPKKLHSAVYIEDSMSCYYSCAGKGANWPELLVDRPSKINPQITEIEKQEGDDNSWGGSNGNADHRIYRLLRENLNISLPELTEKDGIPEGVQWQGLEPVLVSFARAWLKKCLPLLKKHAPEPELVYRFRYQEELNLARDILVNNIPQHEVPTKFRCPQKAMAGDSSVQDKNDQIARKSLAACIQEAIKSQIKYSESGDENGR